MATPYPTHKKIKIELRLPNMVADRFKKMCKQHELTIAETIDGYIRNVARTGRFVHWDNLSWVEFIKWRRKQK